MERIHGIEQIWLKAKQLAPPLCPLSAGWARICFHVQRASHCHKIAQPMKNGLAAIDLDTLENMPMMADHHIGARVDTRLRHGTFVAREPGGRMAQSLMQRDHYNVDIRAQCFDVALHLLQRVWLS